VNQYSLASDRLSLGFERQVLPEPGAPWTTTCRARFNSALLAQELPVYATSIALYCQSAHSVIAHPASKAGVNALAYLWR